MLLRRLTYAGARANHVFSGSSTETPKGVGSVAQSSHRVEHRLDDSGRHSGVLCEGDSRDREARGARIPHFAASTRREGLCLCGDAAWCVCVGGEGIL